MIRVTDRWRYPSRGDREEAKRKLRAFGAFPAAEVDDFVDTVYAMCAEPVMLDAALLVTHFCVETGAVDGGGGGVSPAWAVTTARDPKRNRYNPSGIGITNQYDFGYRWKNGKEAAAAHVKHHAAYEIPETDTAAWKVLRTYPGEDFRYSAIPAQNRGTVVTVADMDGKWWTNQGGPETGANALAERAKWLYGDLPDQELGNMPPIGGDAGGMSVATHKYIISPGHRNADGGGANREIDWTPEYARSLRDAIVARGGEAWILTEEDGGPDKTWYDEPGVSYNGLQAGAVKCVGLARKYGPFDAYISCHYNGGASPGFHAIFPDGWSGTDVKANNPLDVTLARTMASRVKETGTVGLISWTADRPGVMSERETGVGAQGYRLGEFVGTLGFRDVTARVIVEAGSIDTSEKQYLWDKGWIRNTYAEALVNALEDVFGKFKDGTKPEPEPEPDPEYAKVMPIGFATKLNGTDPVFQDGDTYWWPDALTYVATGDVPRLQYAFDTAKPVFAPYAKGQEIVAVAKGVSKTDGKPWLLDKDGARVPVRNMTRKVQAVASIEAAVI